MRSLIILTATVCLTLTSGCAFQNIAVFPGAGSQGATRTIIKPPAGGELIHLQTANGDQITALFGRALPANPRPTARTDGPHDWTESAAAKPTFLYFYGNGGSIAFELSEFNQFRRLGVNVFMPDYAGYGMSSGEPSEASLYATADAAYDYLVNRCGIPPQRIVCVGKSLGAAVAIDLASRRRVGALALFNPFTTIPDMSGRLFPLIPPPLLTTYQFDNLKKIAHVSCPIFLCNGLSDTFVPPEMSDRLASAARAPVTRLKISTADHNTIFTADPHAVSAALTKFLAPMKGGNANAG